MKKIAGNVLCTTGLSLVVLALLGTAYGARFLFINGVFETFGANIVIHTGFLLTHRFESKYSILEIALDIGYAVAVLLTFGAIFSWYSSTPAWMLFLMAVLVYLAGVLLGMIRMRQDIREVNELLQKRNQQNQTER